MADGQTVEARRALYEAVGAAINQNEVTVYAFDPPVVQAPAVTVSSIGPTPDGIQLRVRIYIDSSQSEEAQALMDNVLDDLEDGLPAAYPRTAWSEEYDERKDVWMTQTTLTAPREDF